MSWTDERIETLKTMWEAGQTASQIAEALTGVSRNAVIGKAHRLGLQSRPSPVKPNEVAAGDAGPGVQAASATPAAAPTAPAPVEPVSAAVEPVSAAVEPDAPFSTAEIETDEPEAEFDAEEEVEAEPVQASAAPRSTPFASSPFETRRESDPQPVLRSVGPGGFVRQSPGEQAPPATPAPPRRLVPAKPSAEIAGKTGLLDLNDRICKWPLGHPGEPDFHFCGDKVNPGFPYCIQHCGHAYQAQLPRRDRRPPPPLPFGGARAR
jgi:GcrA cell cycle regulator